jgi:hypothetical protein
MHRIVGLNIGSCCVINNWLCNLQKAASCIILREEHRLRMFENRVLRRMLKT